MARWASVEERFWGRVDKTDTCWLWKTPHTNGYGYISVDSKKQLAHRLAYQWFVGEIPDGLEIDHLCRRRSCVNPTHLEAVTSQENTLRGKVSALRGKRTHCSKGHPLADHGRERLKRGRDRPYTYCVLCTKEASKRNYQSRKEAANSTTQQQQRK